MPLGPLEEPDLVAPAILAALGLRESPHEPAVSRAIEYLRDRRSS